MKVYVDVIIPVHNAAHTIEETVESVMQQSIPDYLISNSNKSSLISSKVCADSEPCVTTKLDALGANVKDSYNRFSLKDVQIDVAICCQNDGSTDESLRILQNLVEQKQSQSQSYPLKKKRKTSDAQPRLSSKLLIASNDDNIARGAGAARNRAASLRGSQMPATAGSSSTIDSSLYFLCLCDSDDVMHPHRIAHQVSVMLALPKEERNSTLLGSTFDRIPADSTWHYTQWANSLTDERLILEQFRELTILQPTWMMTRARFELLGGYIESSQSALMFSKAEKEAIQGSNNHVYKLIHPQYDTLQTMRLAEDLRFFYAHLSYPYIDETKEDLCDCEKVKGSLKVIRTTEPLLSYRHRAGQSQSSSTPRKLLLQLRSKAFTDIVLRKEWNIGSISTSPREGERGFVIWGAGRDGKDFFKSLPEDIKGYVKCFVDVDEKKIINGYYVAPKDDQKSYDALSSKSKRKECFKIPILHWSLLVKDEQKRIEETTRWLNCVENEDAVNGRITKCGKDEGTWERCDNELPKKEANIISSKKERKLHAISKKDKINLKLIETGAVTKLPVVVCVAMYRTNGILERNVNRIGRIEGMDLWHFS